MGTVLSRILPARSDGSEGRGDGAHSTCCRCQNVVPNPSLPQQMLPVLKRSNTAGIETIRSVSPDMDVANLTLETCTKVHENPPNPAMPTIGSQTAVTPFRFLDLPPEIRCLVYEELLVVGKVFYVEDYWLQGNTVRYKDMEYYRKPYLTILQVCKQTHQEAEPLYLSRNLFVLPLHWHLHKPFKLSRNKLFGSPVSMRRHLFSGKALQYLRNISFAIDTKDHYLNPGTYMHSRWSKAQPPLDYESMTHDDRVVMVHDEIITRLADPVNFGEKTCWKRLEETLYQFPTRKFDYIEIDYTNAFCPMGCCRPIFAFWYTWVPNLSPASIDVIGTRSEQEEAHIVECMVPDMVGRISENESENDLVEEDTLTDYYGVQFRKTDDSPRWAAWKYNEPQRSVDQFVLDF